MPQPYKPRVGAPELGIALPGTTLVCCDSHTCTVGGVGALAWGIGASEAEHVLATQTLAQAKPKTMRVRFEGSLPDGVYAKDLVLALIGQLGANGGIGYAVEFAGDVIRKMPIEGRLTLCNMSVEFSAKYGFVAPDEVTFSYLKGRSYAPQGDAWDAAVTYWTSIRSDAAAVFDAEVVIDVSALRPQVTWGTSPQHVCAIDQCVPDPSEERDPQARSSTRIVWVTLMALPNPVSPSIRIGMLTASLIAPTWPASSLSDTRPMSGTPR